MFIDAAVVDSPLFCANIDNSITSVVSTQNDENVPLHENDFLSTIS